MGWSAFMLPRKQCLITIFFMADLIEYYVYNTIYLSRAVLWVFIHNSSDTECVNIFFQCFSDFLNVNSISHSLIQFTSDTNFRVSAEPQVQSSAPQNCPTSDGSHTSLVTTYVSDQPAKNWYFCNSLLLRFQWFAWKGNGI